MKKILHKIELFFHEHVEHYLLYINIADYTIIAIFVADLMFKYVKLRNIPLFLRKYWLEILAIFPFYLLFRLFEGVIVGIGASTIIKQPQAIFHGGLEFLEREGAQIMRAAERSGRISRTRLFFRFLRPIQRLPRFLKLIPYFEKPTHEHHKVIKAIHKMGGKK